MKQFTMDMYLYVLGGSRERLSGRGCESNVYHWNCVLKIVKRARTSHCGSIKSDGISVFVEARNLFKVSADTSGWSRPFDRLDTCTAPVCHRRTSGGVKWVC